MPAFQDLTGQRFGMLEVLERAPNKGKRTVWRCRCDCGNTALVLAEYLKCGDTTSCGCKKMKPNRIFTIDGIGICLIDSDRGDYFWFDVEDIDFVESYQWCVNRSGRAVTNTDSGMQYFYRMLLGVEDARVLVDHANGDIRDNRRCNLRLCSHSENNSNKTIGVKGHTFTKDGKYVAKITKNRNTIVIGSFNTAEEAEAAYYKKAKELFGDFAPHPRRIFFPGLTG